MPPRVSRRPPLDTAYRDDLAYIHDVGFGGFARDAAPGLLALLRRAGIVRGRVVDLGCGSGIWAQALDQAGYDVLGVDQSAAMIRIARERVPRAEFRRQSYLTTKLPPCVAVTSLGECFNYLFDRRNDLPALFQLFQRIYAVLAPGGVLIFDVAGLRRLPGPGPHQKHVEGKDWIVLVTATVTGRRLTRQIISFHKEGAGYRRANEVHHLYLYTPTELARSLRQIGFHVRQLRAYGAMPLPRGVFALVARKPS